jgi:phage tail sheath protein FI
MSTRYSAPGVYVERFDASGHRLGARRTDVAGFVGIAERGPLHTPVRVDTLRQFTTEFGGLRADAYLAYAVAGFFANGGRRCWVVRVADPVAAAPAALRILVEGRGMIALQATSPGTWGNDVEVRAVWGRDTIDRLVARTPDNREQIIDFPDAQTETLRHLRGPADRPLDERPGTLSGIAEDQLPELVPEALVRIVDDSPWFGVGRIDRDSRIVRLEGGADGLQTLTPLHFSGDPEGRRLWGIESLERIDGVSFVAVPDLHTPPAASRPALDEAELIDAQIAIINSCARGADRVAILDLPSGLTPPSAVRYRDAFGQSSYAAAYFPWVMVDDPLLLSGLVRQIPPSGHVAGIYARTDLRRGVQKPPANEPLDGVLDVAFAVDERAHGELNDNGVNAIRPIAGRGILVLGARTLSDDLRWRYVNVRRLFAYIEEVLDEQMQWATFEPGNQRLWSEIDRSVSGFLETLYREGRLDGATPEHAYFVRCDASTNPPWETEAGRVTCVVGIQPPFPAEFVVVRIGVTRNGIDLQDEEARGV